MLKFIIVLWVAFLLDVVLGDPVYRFHPVRMLGKAVSLGEKCLARLSLWNRAGGVVLALGVSALALSAFLLISWVLTALWDPLASVFYVYVCFSCLALRDLLIHMDPVVNALEENDLEMAREKISRVVGRDVSLLDRKGISRAAVETLAENFVDGFVSPLFWYVLGGVLGWLLGAEPVLSALCAMLLFKVASTLDSMVGYKNETYKDVGWAGAKLDDLMNFVPARISLAFMFFGAVLTGRDPFKGLKVGLRDRLKHLSPNAGHGESFAAGALHVRLGGPTVYGRELKEKPWLGAEFKDPHPTHVVKAMWLINFSAWVCLISMTLPWLWLI
jgi:adenosylcobinamide-phosphate synthase